MRLQAATLAVGTEVTDGQILDRNSAWISQKLALSGIEVVEHRAVADDRENIARALDELSRRVNLIFVTGGLGPTSDDFTRELISEVFDAPLEFDSESWRQVQDKLGSRGLVAREIQKQQCFFPIRANILENPAGTANGFSMDVEYPKKSGRKIKIYALPGPPAEIAAVWERNLETEISSFIPLAQRETLRIFRCMGKGESEVAEMTQDILEGTDLRVGYRAHVPYVEVKLWFRNSNQPSQSVIQAVEEKLRPWIVNRDSEDATDRLIELLISGVNISIFDFATSGLFQERVSHQLRALKLIDKTLSLHLETSFAAPETQKSKIEKVIEELTSKKRDGIALAIIARPETETWRIYLRKSDGQVKEVEVEPNFKMKIHMERAKRFITEKSLLLLSDYSED